MLCRICMDRSLDTALFPCGHAVACLECARRCERCPLCRADIDHCKTIYLPIELAHVDKHNMKQMSIDSNSESTLSIDIQSEDVTNQANPRNDENINNHVI